MDPQSEGAMLHFQRSVALKFQLYNSLFTSLPFHRIERTGSLLSVLLSHCEDGFKKGGNPRTIIDSFFDRYTEVTSATERGGLLFRFIQYIERQVVLFDALEDAAFTSVNDMSGPGTLKQLQGAQGPARDKVLQRLQQFSVRPVLTAHPTQFYPGPVLGIINDLSGALKGEEVEEVNALLQQLGKTPFYKEEKPTPYDEATALVWYLENVFYPAAGTIVSRLKSGLGLPLEGPVPFEMGFWPGGDRDGNPNVTAEITLRVARLLRSTVLRCYYRDVRKLKRRLTFKGIDRPIAELEARLYAQLHPGPDTERITPEEVLDRLFAIRTELVHRHNGLSLHLLDDLIGKVQVFGIHFAALDIRQESSVHGTALEERPEVQEFFEQGRALTPEETEVLTDLLHREAVAGLSKDTFESFKAIRSVQEENGEAGCHRYIISQCSSARNVLQVYLLYRLTGTEETVPVDIVPLFETVDDLEGSAAVMRALYRHPVYRKHLQMRGGRQTIMVGFSDGTKDGGYLMANWGIYKAKEALTRVSAEEGVEVVFFDGRGGPPARGGGKTHKFYASMGDEIASREIQITIQGQTVSSNFGTVDAAVFNLEQLLHAGLTAPEPGSGSPTFLPEEVELLSQLAAASFDSYDALKRDPAFITYLEEVSPLRYYGETNIGSRPVKRGNGGRLQLKDLRAIPFVGAWSQLKQNLTAYYGLGAALEALEAGGKWPQLKALYQRSPFFRTLLDNCEMGMKKCFFPLTAHLAGDPRFGELWQRIREEYDRTERCLLRLSGHEALMEHYPVEALSISMRERMVLPLATIQQYALMRLRLIREGAEDPAEEDTLARLVVRSSFGLINAGRNSA